MLIPLIDLNKYILFVRPWSILEDNIGTSYNTNVMGATWT